MTNQIYIISMMYMNYITITLSRGNDMKTTTQELKQYITPSIPTIKRRIMGM